MASHVLLLAALLAAAATFATADRPFPGREEGGPEGRGPHGGPGPHDQGPRASRNCCLDPNGAQIPVQRIGGDKLVFAVIGDWGRVGGVKSVIRREDGGYDSGPKYWCSNPDHGFADDDYDGGLDQKMAAKAMDKACQKAGCKFIISTGDNFYECGLDDPIRWTTDYTSIYQTPSTPHIKDLKWYAIIGNHDIAADGSVEAQIAYGSVNSKWTVNRTYAFEVHNADSSLRLRFGAINTNPFVTKYAKAGEKYNTPEFQAYASPADITSQLNYLSGVLASSNANYDFVLGHHPVFGVKSANGYNATAINPLDEKATDLGRPDASGGNSWETLVSILRQYNPSAYMNGHDHTMGLAADVNADINNPGTLYLTSGAGSAPETVCKVAGYRTNVLYDRVRDHPDAIAACGGVDNTGPGSKATPNPNLVNVVGFSIMTVTKETYQIDLYNSEPDGTPQLIYTITRPNTKTQVPEVSRGCMC